MVLREWDTYADSVLTDSTGNRDESLAIINSPDSDTTHSCRTPVGNWSFPVTLQKK